MIRTADYIVRKLEEIGVRDVFMVVGGGAMYLNEAVGRSDKIHYICHHHEQACAIAAEGYSRTKNGLAVVLVTSGPGGTNTLTGVIGQWLDSVPVLYISGQVKFETCISSCPSIGLRQLGDQEINIVDIVRPVTKYATMLTEPKNVRKELEKAIYIATTGRRGPVWLDIPLNVQEALVDEELLEPFGEFEEPSWLVGAELEEKSIEVIHALENAERPVFVAGHGIRIANAKRTFLSLAEKLGIPVVSTFNGFDIIPTEHPLFVGRIGTLGSRAGNFALQNSDLVICVGTRNNIRQVSYNWEAFARNAKKIVADIDEAELKKHTVKPDFAIHADAGEFLKNLEKSIEGMPLPSWSGWLSWCTERKRRYPIVMDEYRKLNTQVHPYHFIDVLTRALDDDAVVVAGNGSACVVLFQAGTVKENQRIFWNSGCAAMGYGLPAAIGACFAAGKTNVVCIEGDGSLQMNIQELQTVIHHKLPLKIFVLNNHGYISIRQTQESFFDGHYVGCDETCGVSFPDYTKVAAAYGLQTTRLDSPNGMEEKIRKILDSDRPCLCEVMLPWDYKFLPKLSSKRRPDGTLISKPLEDMFPFLDRKELKENMLIPVLDDEE